MAQMTPKVAEVLDKAMELSSHERSLLIDRLVESLDDAPPNEGIDEAWADEHKVRSKKVIIGTRDRASTPQLVFLPKLSRV